MGLLETALVGHLGSTELATLGAANTLLNLLFTILIFLEYGTTARLSQRFGAGEIDLLLQEAIQMGWLATVLGFLMTGILIFFSRPLLQLLQVTPEVLSMGSLYLSIRALGGIPGLWIRLGNGIFRGLQNTKTPLILVIGINLLNALLSIILIFGRPELGIPAFGIVGAAWATVIATWVGGITFLLSVGHELWAMGGHPKAQDPESNSIPIKETKKNRLTAPRPRSIVFWPHWEILRDVLTISRDLLLRTLALQAALFTGSRMAASFGTTSLAAHQVGWQLWTFSALLLDSLAIAGQALVGKTLGAGQADHAQSIGNRLCRWGLGLGTIFCFGFLILQDFLPKIFTQDPEVLETVNSIFGLLAWMQIPNSVLFVLDGLLIGASDMVFIRNSMVSLGLLGVLLTWWGGTVGGNLKGVWVGITLFMLTRLGAMGLRWIGKGWIR
jgi:Na+-driven multidrug efflux pump